MMRQRAGYTIIEVLVFLAVSAMLAAAILPQFSGQQDKVQFSQAVNDLESKISDVINDVSTGYFPRTDFKCTSAGGIVTITGSGSVGQGTNQGCIFVGKAMHFNHLSGQDPMMNIFTIVGQRQVDGDDVGSLKAATPKAVAPVDSSDVNTPEMTDIYPLKWGLEVTQIVTLPGTDAYAIAITTPLSPNAANNPNSFAKTVSVEPLTGSFDQRNTNFDVATKINNQAQWLSPTINPPQGILICLSSANDNQRAVILIGGAAGTGKLRTTFDTDNIISMYGSDPCGV